MDSPQPDITFVLGGARSGKSAFAEKLVRDTGLQRIYLATGRAFDAEMEERVRHHRETRDGDNWRTVEAPLDLVDALARERACAHAILVDCLTLWVTNLMLEDRDVAAESARLVDCLMQPSAGPLVLVSNEVGLGIVPDNAMARAFRDHAGRLHQSVAAAASRVFLIAAGLPLTLKA